jgi:hypothetical protein
MCQCVPLRIFWAKPAGTILGAICDKRRDCTRPFSFEPRAIALRSELPLLRFRPRNFSIALLRVRQNAASACSLVRPCFFFNCQKD